MVGLLKGYQGGGGIMGNPAMAGKAPMPAPAAAPTIIERTGLIPSASSGRADALVVQIPSESYIFPADIVSALGDGNTAAGGRVIDAMTGQKPEQPGPAGMPPALPPQGGIAPPAAKMNMPPQGLAGAMPARANGGQAQEGAPKMVPIRISGGEYAMLPPEVTMIGGGDLQHGHDVLDEFVKHVRDQTSKKLKKIPDPKK